MASAQLQAFVLELAQDLTLRSAKVCHLHHHRLAQGVVSQSEQAQGWEWAPA